MKILKTKNMIINETIFYGYFLFFINTIISFKTLDINQLKTYYLCIGISLIFIIMFYLTLYIFLYLLQKLYYENGLWNFLCSLYVSKMINDDMIYVEELDSPQSIHRSLWVKLSLLLFIFASIIVAQLIFNFKDSYQMFFGNNIYLYILFLLFYSILWGYIIYLQAYRTKIVYPRLKKFINQDRDQLENLIYYKLHGTYFLNKPTHHLPKRYIHNVKKIVSFSVFSSSVGRSLGLITFGMTGLIFFDVNFSTYMDYEERFFLGTIHNHVTPIIKPHIIDLLPHIFIMDPVHRIEILDKNLTKELTGINNKKTYYENLFSSNKMNTELYKKRIDFLNIYENLLKDKTAKAIELINKNHK